jgi:hypothetical protein
MRGPDVTVATRLVLMFPGFEPLPAEAHCRRFVREAAKSAPHYGMMFSTPPALTEPRSETAIGTGVLSVTATGAGWRTQSEIVVYELSELNEDYGERNVGWRFVRGFGAVGDFIVTGTFFRYLATGWRYGFFFIFPLLVLIGALLAGWLGHTIGAMVVPTAPTLAGSATAIAVAGLWLVFAQYRWNFMLALDDWAFASDIARGKRPDLERRFALLSEDIMRRLSQSSADEVLFAAHSFGAIAAVSALADALSARKDAGRLNLLTVGSSLLKIALHPAAKRLRAAVETIVSADRPWLDVQSLTDILNFYGTRPAELIAGRSGANQNTTKVRFRLQLEPATYKAIKRDFFRVHRQFVYGVERRSHYSYHAILCGPEPFADVVRRGGLSDNWSALASEAGQASAT